MFSFTRLYLGVFLVALGTLLLEISFVRILSYTIWYHFAYVVISTALLGFGAAGTLLAVHPMMGGVNIARSLSICSIGAAVSVLVAILIVGVVPLDPVTLFKKPGQLFVLIIYQFVATAPFFFAGIAISLALREAAERVDRLYFWDLVGAGLGCVVAVPLMNQISPPGAVLAAAGCLASAAAVFGRSRKGKLAATIFVVLLFSAAPFGAEIEFTPAESKILITNFDSRENAVLEFSRWTALFRTDFYRRTQAQWSTQIEPWGLSTKARRPVQQPWGVVLHDAFAGTHAHNLNEGDLAYLDEHVLSLPYRISNPRPKVLVIGVGGGSDVITAMRFGASHVTGVELDPMTVDLVRDHLSPINGNFFKRPEVDLIAAEGRHFVKKSRDRFDVIQITGVDTLAATNSGAYVLAENYIYTVEAFHEYLDHLEPNGVLSIATGLWLTDKPDATARIMNVARTALYERGVAEPAENIAVINSTTLLAEVMIKNEPFSKKQIAKLSEQSRRLDFQPLVLGNKGLPTWRTIVGEDRPERTELIASLPYRIDAIRDDSPFFFCQYRWRDLFRIGTGDLGPAHTSPLGQLVLAVLLLLLSLMSVVFILGPLFLFRRRAIVTTESQKSTADSSKSAGVEAAVEPGARRGGFGRTLGILGYFLAIGLGFMLFEISLIQRFILYLGYPTYSLSVVLFALLTFLGIGSYLSRFWVGKERIALPTAFVVLAGFTLFLIYGLPALQDWTLDQSLTVRVVITLIILAPLGITLGIFFPLGIRRANALHRDLVPWAWGINGCASVTAAVLAVVLAMSHGFVFVWILSLFIYLIGIASIYGQFNAESQSSRPVS
jgi:spermidine synthase